MSETRVLIEFSINCFPLPEEAQRYFTYRYSELKIVKETDNSTHVSFQVASRYTEKLENGIKNVLVQNMKLYGVKCTNWSFKEINA